MLDKKGKSDDCGGHRIVVEESKGTKQSGEINESSEK